MKLSIKMQKYIYITILALINILLSVTFIIYSNRWYAYLFILALGTTISSFSAIILFLKKLIKKIDTRYIYRKEPRNYIYIVPCYNESEEELTLSLNSLIEQQRIDKDNYSLMIICDGKAKGKGNNNTTDNILKDILNIIEEPRLYYYITADKNKNFIEYYSGTYKNTNYRLLIKQINYGKRDSLVLARRICYSYNKKYLEHEYISKKLLDDIYLEFDKIYDTLYNNTIEYIIGIDADTIFDYRCSYELIKEIELHNDDTIKGCVGFVDINKSMNHYSFFVLYQYAEYLFAQCLRRQAQSEITHKVNCLSGCNQILKICEETCGELILKKFNYLPDEEENIFNHIRSYASEDRNHVALVLSNYPYVKTIQSLDAISWTSVPTSISVFMSQRRRWSLGATTNDMLLIYLPGINIFERFASIINVFTYMLNPFIFIATILFLKTLFVKPTYLVLYLSIIMMIPLLYALLIPIFIKPLIFRDAIYYYISFLFYLTTGSVISLLIYFNSIFNMDIIKWGKTRSVDNTNDEPNTLFEESEININENDLYLDDESDYKLKNITIDNPIDDIDV
jgi:chitin synthase